MILEKFPKPVLSEYQKTKDVILPSTRYLALDKTENAVMLRLGTWIWFRPKHDRSQFWCRPAKGSALIFSLKSGAPRLFHRSDDGFFRDISKNVWETESLARGIFNQASPSQLQGDPRFDKLYNNFLTEVGVLSREKGWAEIKEFGQQLFHRRDKILQWVMFPILRSMTAKGF